MKNQRRLQSAMFLLLATAGACERVSEGEARLPEGSIVVDSAAVQVFATSSSLAAVRDLEVLPDGSVWLLNSVEPLFLGFTPDGTLLRQHGSVGGGPREFGRPAGLVLGGIDGQAWVFDWQRHLLVEVSRPDGVRRELAIPAESIPQGSVLG